MKRKFKDWIKCLFLGSLICTGVSACSDDALEGTNTPDTQKENTPAYLTVSFSTSGNSSRSTADDANNTGDKDGNAEDSGHVNVGTDAENAVNSALVVVKATNGETGFAKLYQSVDENGELTTTTTTGSDKIYAIKNPIQLNTGIYEVLVVANPYEGLYSDYNKDNSIGGDGISDANSVTALYNAILTGTYENKLKTQPPYNYAGEIVQIDTGTEPALKGIMMANKAAVSKEIGEADQKESPAVATVEVERVASKVTFRSYGYNSTTEKVELITEQNESLEENVYPVAVTLPSKIEPIVYSYEDKKLNKATFTDEYGNKSTIFVVVNSNGEKEYYQESAVTITEEGAVNSLKDKDETTDYTKGSISYHHQETQVQNDTWYVKLEGYSLVNLAKKVYNVRHTINNPVGEDGVPFGALTGKNYLYTPYWPEINSVNLEANEFTYGDTNFFRALSAVSADSKNSTTTLFTEFANTLSGSDEVQDVTGEGDKQQHTTPLNPIGNLLAYCLENSTDEAHQAHGLSTGIAFKARIYSDPKCEEADKIENLYRYAGHLFQTIESLQDAYDITPVKGQEGLAGLTEESDADALADAGVVKYSSNICYYYTTEIKHFDNDNDTELGNMEFAIMRNNIYSLAVTGINVIGDPYVDPLPSTPNEILETYLTVEAKIMPWIVRYHDIEFN